MSRLVWVSFALLTLSGCFDFDAAYLRFCDGGRCSAPFDAGPGEGGGAGGGTAMTSGGGAGGGGAALDSDAGAADAGVPDAGVPDAGVPDSGTASIDAGEHDAGSIDAGPPPDAGSLPVLIPEIDWASSIASIQDTVAPGLYTTSFQQFYVYASFEADAPGSNNYLHYEFRFVDGGVTSIPRFTGFPDNVEARQLKGSSPSDLWYAYRLAVQRREGTATAQYLTDCTLSAGGTTSPRHYAVLVKSSEEAWLVGYPGSVCHWTRSGGLVATFTPGAWPEVRLQDVYQTPSGQLFAAGGDYNRTAQTSACVIFNETGTPIGVPLIIDDWYADGCNSIDGVGEEVYALASSNAQRRGQILKRQPNGTFESVYTAPYRLSRLDVTAAGEVWAVGATGATAIYFNGIAWREVELPSTVNRPDVALENINATDQGLIITGYETMLDGGNVAIVNTYRFLGK